MCPLPLWFRSRGGHTRLWERGWGDPNSDEATWRHCGTLGTYVLCALYWSICTGTAGTWWGKLSALFRYPEWQVWKLQWLVLPGNIYLTDPFIFHLDWGALVHTDRSEQRGITNYMSPRHYFDLSVPGFVHLVINDQRKDVRLEPCSNSTSYTNWPYFGQPKHPPFVPGFFALVYMHNVSECNTVYRYLALFWPDHAPSLCTWIFCSCLHPQCKRVWYIVKRLSYFVSVYMALFYPPFVSKWIFCTCLHAQCKCVSESDRQPVPGPILASPSPVIFYLDFLHLFTSTM